MVERNPDYEAKQAKRMIPMGQFLSARSRAQVCTFFLVLHGVIVLVSIVSTLFEIDLLLRFQSGETVSEPEAQSNDDRQMVIGAFYFLSYLLVVITFLVWVYRASKNLAALGFAPWFSHRWAVGWWFVPIANLFMPYQVMKELWRCSNPKVLDEGQRPRWLPIWWAGWLISLLTSNVTASLYLGSESADDLITAGWVSIVSDVFTMVALVLVLVLIQQITSNQYIRHMEL